ncbi:MAG: hypothetical protein Q7T20_13645 [Saprospiraceae bacterium]|nr:hypothetical protein [Saprospiraceae bacterium]
MACIQTITAEFRQGNFEEREAMKRFFQCDEAQKIAWSVYSRYKKKLYFIDWDVVLTDAVVRFMERLVLEKERGVKPIEKSGAIFWLICNQCCWKYLKMPGYGTADEQILETFTSMVNTGNNPGLYEKLVGLLDQLGFPCGKLLYLNYLAEPPVKDYEKLFKTLSEEAREKGVGLRVTSASGIPNLLWHSRKKFRDFLKGHSDLDELL